MILDEIAALTPPNFAAAAAAELEETESGAARAVRDLAAALLAALTRRVDDGAAYAALFAILSDPENARIDDDFSSLAASGAATAKARNATALVDALLGANAAPVTAAIARSAGVRPPSAAALLQFAAPLVMSGLARKIAAEKLTAQTMGKALLAERDQIMRALPYEASSALKISSAMDIVREKPADLRTAPPKPRTPAWMWAALAALLVAAVYLLLQRNSAPQPVEEAASAAAEPAPELPAEAEAPTAPYGADAREDAETVDRGAAPD